MVESKIKCDVCGSNVEHITKLHMVAPSEHKEWIIPCLCEGCRDAIESALDMRQRVVGCTVQSISGKPSKR